MPRHTLVLRRDTGVDGFMSDQSLGSDASRAMSSMPGVENPEIVTESEDQVTVSYDWVGKEQFWDAGDHLRRHGLTWDDAQQDVS